FCGIGHGRLLLLGMRGARCRDQGECGRSQDLSAIELRGLIIHGRSSEVLRHYNSQPTSGRNKNAPMVEADTDVAIWAYSSFGHNEPARRNKQRRIDNVDPLTSPR